MYPDSPSLPPGVLGHHICTPYIFAYRVCDLAATRKQANYRRQLYSIVIPDKHMHTSTTIAADGAGGAATTNYNNAYTTAAATATTATSNNKVYTQQGGDGYKSMIPVTTHNTGIYTLLHIATTAYYYILLYFSHINIIHLYRILVLWPGRNLLWIFGFRHRH